MVPTSCQASDSIHRQQHHERGPRHDVHGPYYTATAIEVPDNAIPALATVQRECSARAGQCRVPV
jgi:hypothetical protein